MTENFVVHSNDMACRKGGRIGLDPVITTSTVFVQLDIIFSVGHKFYLYYKFYLHVYYKLHGLMIWLYPGEITYPSLNQFVILIVRKHKKWGRPIDGEFSFVYMYFLDSGVLLTPFVFNGMFLSLPPSLEWILCPWGLCVLWYRWVTKVRK